MFCIISNLCYCLKSMCIWASEPQRATLCRSAINYSSSSSVLPSVFLWSHTHAHTHSHTLVWQAARWTFLSAGFLSASARGRRTLTETFRAFASLLALLCSWFSPTAADLPLAPRHYWYSVLLCSCFPIMHLFCVLLYDSRTETTDACEFVEYLCGLSLFFFSLYIFIHFHVGTVVIKTVATLSSQIEVLKDSVWVLSSDPLWHQIKKSPLECSALCRYSQVRALNLNEKWTQPWFHHGNHNIRASFVFLCILQNAVEPKNTSAPHNTLKN